MATVSLRPLGCETRSPCGHCLIVFANGTQTTPPSSNPAFSRRIPVSVFILHVLFFTRLLEATYMRLSRSTRGGVGEMVCSELFVCGAGRIAPPSPNFVFSHLTSSLLLHGFRRRGDPFAPS